MAQPIGDGDITHVNMAIDRMTIIPPSRAQRRQAALSVCDILGRCGESSQGVHQVLQALGLTEQL